MLKQTNFAQRIAAILIIGGFVLIAGILYLNHINEKQFIDIINNKTRLPEINATDLTNLHNSITDPSSNLFTIVFSLLGAWIGAVLAFYFGAQSLDRAYSSLDQAQTSIANVLSSKKLQAKVKEFVEKYPETKNIFTDITLDTPVKDIVSKAGDTYQHLLITDNNKNPKGLLFMSDLKRDVTTETIQTEGTKSFKDFIKDKTITDFITKQKWTENGVVNFATVGLEDSLQNVVNKMKEIGDYVDVRAIVLDANKKPTAIITFDIISKEVQS